MIAALALAAAVTATQPSKADLVGIDAAIRGVYEVISGPAGQKRDWERMRTLFAPGARLILTVIGLLKVVSPMEVRVPDIVVSERLIDS